MLFFAQAAATPPLSGFDPTNFVETFGALGEALSTRMFDIGVALYIDILGPLGLDFARAVFPLVLMAELMFVGFRIIMKESFVQQILRIVLISIINYAIIYSQYPQQLLISGMIAMDRCGRFASAGIIQSDNMIPIDTLKQFQLALKSNTSPLTQDARNAINIPVGSEAAKGAEALFAQNSIPNPVVTAWGAWLGNISDSNNFKYSPVYLHNALFGGEIVPPTVGSATASTTFAPGAAAVNSWLNKALNTNNLFSPSKNPILYNAQAVYGGTGGGLGTVYKNFMGPLSSNTTVPLGSLIVSFFQPLQFLVLALTLALIMLTGIMTPGLTAGTILGSAYLTFFITLSFGVCIVPFAFFRTLEKSWNKWLRLLLGMAFVPFIYYIFGAIGFVFSVDVFDVLFNQSAVPGPPVGAGQTTPSSSLLGTILASVFNYAIAVSMMLQSGVANLSGSNAGDFGEWISYLISYVTFCAQFFAQNSSGAIIITTFISIGCTFPFIATKVALNWESGFAEPAIMEQLQGGLNQIQGSIGQGFSSGMQGGLNSMGSMVGRAMS